MATFNRIDKIGISRRGLLTGLYGNTHTSEYFVGKDLALYDFTQALTLSLMDEGYNVVIYNPANNIGMYSYVEQHLCEFYNLPASTDDGGGKGYVKKGLMTPLGPMEDVFKDNGNSVNASGGISSHNGSICTHVPGNPARAFFKLRSTQDPFSDVFAYAERKPGSKMAVIFENPGDVLMTSKKMAEIESRFSNLLKLFSIDGCRFRMLVIYPEKSLENIVNTFAGREANPTIFYGHTIAVHLGLAGLRNGGNRSKEEQDNLSRNMFHVSTPETDEITNFMVRKRVMGGCAFTLDHDRPFAAMVNAISSGNFKLKRSAKDDMAFATDDDILVKSLMNCELKDLVKGINTDGSRRQLQGMIGLESTVKQYFELVEMAMNLKAHGNRMRMHMKFLGPPGTGKTTVARLAGQDLRDLGLLSKGHFTEVKKQDLVGEYVGESEAKAQEICEKALGGVLFIDEAYTLFGGGLHDNGSDIYGKAALEVIMTYMEDHYDDFVVIMAGYPDEMELMERVNSGLPSRFNPDGRIMFPEYSPENLFSIAKKRLGYETSPAFDDKLSSIIKFKFSRRNIRKWGNAREVIAITDSILNRYYMQGGTGVLDVAHIPAKVLASVDSKPKSEAELFAPLNDIVGLSGVRENLGRLARQMRINHIRAQGVEGGDYGDDINLAFMFIGNPGSGKTTVARKMGQLFKNIGVLDCGDVVTVGVDKLNSGIQGETESNVQRMFEDNVGKVVFIDEAYQLGESGNRIALNKITELLTDTRFKGKLAIVMAGYTGDMMRMMDLNRGLASRFGRNVIRFEDYTADELWLILLSMMRRRQLSFSDEAASEPLAKAWFNSLPDDNQFANGRKCERLIEEMDMRCYARLGEDGLTPESLSIFVPEDIPAPMPGHGTLPHADVPGMQHFNLDLSGETPGGKVSDPEDLSKSVGMVTTNRGGGTGFVISIASRMVMTCYHVIEGAGSINFRINGLDDAVSPARCVWCSPKDDMAILQVESLPVGTMYLDIRPAGMPTVPSLTPIILCGFPYGENISRNLMVNRGEINSYEKGKRMNDGTMDVYFSSVPATHGNSGGPVLIAESMQVMGLLQGGMEDIGPVGVRIIADLAPIYRDKNITITNK